MTIKNIKILIIISFSLTGNIYAHSLDDLVDSEVKNELMQNGFVNIVQTKTIDPHLIPDIRELQILLTKTIEELKPTMSIEALYLYKKPDSVPGKSWTDAQKIQLFNGLRALSTLTGIQYYSVSRKSMRTFYESSYIIDNPETKKKLPDTYVNEIIDYSYQYALQKDTTFGENIYKYEYYIYPDAIVFTQKNITPMKYGIITLIAGNELQSVIGVADAGDNLLLYSNTLVKINIFPGIENRARDSFINRTNAIYSWFSKIADKVFE